MKKKICVIVNPISGKGKNRFLAEKILSEFEPEQYETVLFFSQAPLHSTELARQAVAKGADVVVAVGGDGSINEVGHGLIGSDTALAIIPTGSGNGLARHLKIPLELNKAVAVIKQGHSTLIDAVQVNDRFFFSAAGIGFDAEVGWSFSKFGHRGFLSYIFVSLREFLKHRPSVYDLLIDGKKLSREAFLISFANGSQFGNGAVIAPNAQIDDGSVDVVILKKFPLFAVPMLVYQLFNRTIDQSKYVEIFKAKNIAVDQPDLRDRSEINFTVIEEKNGSDFENFSAADISVHLCKEKSSIDESIFPSRTVKVISERSLKGHVDGEPILLQGNMQVSVVPSALKVIVGTYTQTT